MAKLTSIMMIGFCAALAACVSHQQTTVLPAGNSAVNNAAIVSALNAIRSGKPVPITKTMAMGTTLKLDATFELNPDCTPAGTPNVRITQDAAHGATRVTKENLFPNYLPANPRSACNKTRAPGVVTYYTPEKDFTGTDNVTMETIGDGVDLVYNITIIVK